MRKNNAQLSPHHPSSQSHIERSNLNPVEPSYSQFDQFDQYFNTAPQVTLELPSPDSSTLNHFSQFSISSGSSISPQEKFQTTRLNRRNSFIPTSSYDLHVLALPQGRSRSSSIGSVSAEDINRLRKFSVSGNKIINKGDSSSGEHTEEEGYAHMQGSVYR